MPEGFVRLWFSLGEVQHYARVLSDIDADDMAMRFVRVTDPDWGDEERIYSVEEMLAIQDSEGAATQPSAGDQTEAEPKSLTREDRRGPVGGEAGHSQEDVSTAIDENTGREDVL